MPEPTPTPVFFPDPVFSLRPTSPRQPSTSGVQCLGYEATVINGSQAVNVQDGGQDRPPEVEQLVDALVDGKLAEYLLDSATRTS
jgi:hypothetical protein